MLLTFPPPIPTCTGVFKHAHPASKHEEPLFFFKAYKDAFDSTLPHIFKTLPHESYSTSSSTVKPSLQSMNLLNTSYPIK